MRTEMVQGYFDGLDDDRAELPASLANRTQSYIHGWLNGRDDRINRPARSSLCPAGDGAGCGRERREGDAMSKFPRYGRGWSEPKAEGKVARFFQLMREPITKRGLWILFASYAAIVIIGNLVIVAVMK